MRGAVGRPAPVLSAECDFGQFHSCVWSFLEVQEYHFRQLHLVFQGGPEWLMSFILFLVITV